MVRKEIGIWSFFDELIRRAPEAQRQYVADGRRCQQQVVELRERLRRSYLYQQQEHGRRHDDQPFALRRTVARATRRRLAQFYKESPRFKICIVSQRFTKALTLESDLKERYPQLNIKRIIGSDSGETKRQALEDINKTVEDVKQVPLKAGNRVGRRHHGQGQAGIRSAQLQEQLATGLPRDVQPLPMRRGSPYGLLERRGA